MNLEIVNYLMDAYELVSAWELADEDFAEAVRQQAYLMAGLDPIEAIPLFDD
jgi:hypothetical protein